MQCAPASVDVIPYYSGVCCGMYCEGLLTGVAELAELADGLINNVGCTHQLHTCAQLCSIFLQVACSKWH